MILSTEQTVRPKSQCEQHRDGLQSGLEQSGRPSVGAFIPQCDADGSYRPLQVRPHSVLVSDDFSVATWHSEAFNDVFQCHGSTGHCWCVDIRGQERAGTRTPPGTAPADCDKPGDIYKNPGINSQKDCHRCPLTNVYFSPLMPERPKTLCERQRDSIQTTSPEGFPITGLYAPQCDDDGQYTPLQVQHKNKEQGITRNKWLFFDNKYWMLIFPTAVSWLDWTLLVRGQSWTGTGWNKNTTWYNTRQLWSSR